VTTTSAGTYTVPSLIPGRQNFRGGQGFKVSAKGINVSANQDNVADASSDLGVATEIVEVSSGAVEYKPRRLL